MLIHISCLFCINLMAIIGQGKSPLDDDFAFLLSIMVFHISAFDGYKRQGIRQVGEL